MNEVPDQPPVLIAVVTYESSDVLPGLLRSLPQALEGVTRWRLVVSDNASADGSADLAAELAPAATVLRNEVNLGYAAGINACASVAEDDEALLVLNADVQLAPGCVAALLAASAAGVTIPLVRTPQGRPELSLRRRPTALRLWGEVLLGRRASAIPLLGEEVHPKDHSGQKDADWVNGAIMLIPAQVRHAAGWWDERYFLYSEEVDYCRRVRESGWRIVQVPGAVAVHQGGEVARSPRLWAQLTTNRVVHLARWEGRASAMAGWAALVVAQLLRLPLRRKIHRRALSALLAGRRRLLMGTPVHPAAPPNLPLRRHYAPQERS